MAVLFKRVAFLFVTIVLLSDCASVSGGDAKQVIVLPDYRVLGNRIGAQSPLQKIEDASAAFPESLQFDLDGPTVYGLIATYPSEVSFDDLVAAVNLKHRAAWKDADGTMSKHGVTVWRDEEERCAIQVADSQVIMILLDRRVTEREQEVWAEAAVQLTSEMLKEAVQEQESTED